jgi:hypothetical protein
MDLEKRGPKRHTHFKKGEQLPLTIAIHSDKVDMELCTKRTVPSAVVPMH